MKTKFRISASGIGLVFVAGLLFYFAVVTTDIPMLVVSSTVLLTILFLSILSLILCLKFSRLKSGPQVIYLNSEAGRKKFVEYFFDCNIPLPFFSFRLPQITTETFALKSKERLLSFNNLALFEIHFFRRMKNEIHLDLEISSPGSIFRVIVEDFLTLRTYIYPLRINEMDESIEKILNAGSLISLSGKGSGDPLHLRQYAPGDPMKRIAWKIYAKTKQLIVRELERSFDESDAVVLLADPLPEDEPLAFTAILLKEKLEKSDAKIYYGTTLEINLYDDALGFVDKILESSTNGTRYTLKQIVSANMNVLTGSTLIYLVSDNSKNSLKVKEIDELKAHHNIQLIVVPSMREFHSFYNLIFEDQKDYILSRDGIFKPDFQA
ncbi:MAG: DUF58 domain-containing protein [Deltaproteobacteria bacterium]|nr:DUF58 domain-containing protein [Deltaproteobacteria bacterium]MCX7952333.1 DUF58 domain-containing protein [Deltaproteobacteria bacterium]